ncbi:MAG: helix-turn-helix transcriptional regulator [Sporocytophaga sp.]|jgi:transcriptional regulator with XRE-family HTH domain|nr:helix-turn-helix transcriptional regulator [Sporocytophaga sp.]
MLTLGNKIKKVRELKGLKQEYMAEVLGISQPSYSKIETDEVSVSPERLEQIAKVLQVSVQDILAFDERVFFNITNRDQSYGSGYFVQNNSAISENEKKLYEDKIKLLEELVEMQKKEIERLKGEK